MRAKGPGSQSVSSFAVPERSQSLTSGPPLTIHLPSGLNATLFTEPACPLSARNSRPDVASHTLALPSQVALATHLPSGLKATEYTKLVCPLSVMSCWPD